VSGEVRLQAMALIVEATQAGARKRKACELLGITVRTLERWEKRDSPLDKRKESARTPSNKLTQEERQVILETVNSEPYRDLPPCKIVPMLADDGCYIGSESTIYRVLRAENQLSHRSAVRLSKHHKPKAYIAGRSNQIWTWDISYLPTRVRGLYFYLYMIVDIYSRKIVGWSLHEIESSDHAASLIKQACLDEYIPQAPQLVLHSDNGSPMKGSTMLAMLENLGVIPSFSRPSVSDDNPYSEALFKTLKYHPTFPMLDKFETISDARSWCEKFVEWYNTQHLHSALKFVTPEQRHRGEDIVVRQKRHTVYEKAKQRHPDRWTRNTRDWSLPDVVTLNPDKKFKLNKQKDDIEFKLIA
jgi:putative transposase